MLYSNTIQGVPINMTEEIIIVLTHSLKSEHLKIIFFSRNSLLFIFLWFFIIGFDGYYIVRTDEGQP